MKNSYKIYDLTTHQVIVERKTLNGMLGYLSTFQKESWLYGKYRKGIEKIDGYFNKYLDGINVTLNDMMVVGNELVLRPYVFLNPNNDIIDMRNYIDDIVKISKAYAQKSKHRFNDARYPKNNRPEFRNGSVPGVSKSHEHRGSYYRIPSIMNAKRDAANPENKDYIRPCRRVINLPDPWDDYPRHIDKSWKTNSKKRKQWM